MGWWSDLWKTQAEDWIVARLETAKRVPIKPNTAYVSMFMKSARIPYVRKGLKRFHGAVHSYISLPHLSGDKAEFNVVTTPQQLKNVDASNLGRVVSLNQRLVGPVPYRGGDIEVELALVSIKESDLAVPYLSLLESISTKAGVAYVNAALPFADPITRGIDLLAGADNDSILEIGFSQCFPKPETGFLTVIGASRGQVAVGDLRVDGNDFKLLDAGGNALTDYPYIVLEVSCKPEREAWFQIPELAKAYDEIREHVRRNRYNDVQEAVITFKRIAGTCNDLLPKDATRISQLVEEQVFTLMGATATARGEGPEVPELRDLSLYP